MLSNYLLEAYFYAIVAGSLFVSILLLGAIVLLPALFRNREKYLPYLLRTSIFLGLLFVWGGIANSLWFALPTERWYVQADPLVRYLPIIPFGSWMLDEVCGGHLLPGTSMLSLQALWLLFTVVVWSLSWFCFGRLVHPRAQRASRT